MDVFFFGLRVSEKTSRSCEASLTDREAVSVATRKVSSTRSSRKAVSLTLFATAGVFFSSFFAAGSKPVLMLMGALPIKSPS